MEPVAPPFDFPFFPAKDIRGGKRGGAEGLGLLLAGSMPPNLQRSSDLSALRPDQPPMR